MADARTSAGDKLQEKVVEFYESVFVKVRCAFNDTRRACNAIYPNYP